MFGFSETNFYGLKPAATGSWNHVLRRSDESQRDKPAVSLISRISPSTQDSAGDLRFAVETTRGSARSINNTAESLQEKIVYTGGEASALYQIL